ncbi:oxidoreductase [Acrocarpospora corrugata]|uniref:Oxidoreductase n=1 Tax=Acrocarpospora corrugata TaxID=35763 RepID=A0A5M3VV51_9ACTN|nr:NADH:flavin oxidoreductase/NADH oxidase [Acrocarpospora corrugata]GES00384.1 oxidoreductase [Acrocarpospora corrugata]
MLFEPLTLRSLTIPNRVWMSPMCQYSARDGVADDWHLTHLGARAVGGAGLVFAEATAVSAEGRISSGDLGLWNDDQEAALTRIARFVAGQGAVPGIQVAHAGRKASTDRPWRGGGPTGEWQPVGPSPIPFAPGHPAPDELSPAAIRRIAGDFAAAARRALRAGFRVLEVHGAHGYLIGEFLSPLSNHRTDAYGGPFENRVRFALQVVDAVREAWPADLPLFFRISATDWLDDRPSWTVDDTVRLAPILLAHGVDLLDTSSGGNAADARIPTGPGYQVPFAARVRAETALPVAAVGMITDPYQAEQILADGAADAVLIGRELLRDPYWPRRAARALGTATRWPDQYHRAV